MKKLRKNITEEEIEDSLKEHALTPDGKISFDEFKKMFILEVEARQETSDFEIGSKPSIKMD